MQCWKTIISIHTFVLGFLRLNLSALLCCFHLTWGLLGQKANLIKSLVRTRACVLLSEARWSPVLMCVHNSQRCAQPGLASVTFSLSASRRSLFIVNVDIWKTAAGGDQGDITLPLACSSSSHPTPLTPDVTASNTRKPGSNPPLALRPPARELLAPRCAPRSPRRDGVCPLSWQPMSDPREGKRKAWIFFSLSPFPEHKFTSSWLGIIRGKASLWHPKLQTIRLPVTRWHLCRTRTFLFPAKIK